MYLFLENQNTIIPLEVKASENLRSKSLKTFAINTLTFTATELPFPISASPFPHLPLYGAGWSG